MPSLSMGVMTWIQKVRNPGKIPLGNLEVIRQHHQRNGSMVAFKLQETVKDGVNASVLQCMGSQREVGHNLDRITTTY